MNRKLDLEKNTISYHRLSFVQLVWCANSQSCIRMCLWGVIPPPSIWRSIGNRVSSGMTSLELFSARRGMFWGGGRSGTHLVSGTYIEGRSFP
eukprot:COSAG01_NODE_231_length_21019_cov_104.980501_6_plen_93_part_00